MAGIEIVLYELKKAQRDREELSKAVIGGDLRRSWESFLQNFSRALGKLIKLSNDDPRSKAFGYRRRNAARKDDEGLVFLREARNVDEHGLEPSAE